MYPENDEVEDSFPQISNRQQETLWILLRQAHTVPISLVRIYENRGLRGQFPGLNERKVRYDLDQLIDKGYAQRSPFGYKPTEQAQSWRAAWVPREPEVPDLPSEEAQLHMACLL